MDDNINKCPLCGKSISDDEIFCHECREIADTSYPEELLTHYEDSEILIIEEDIELEYTADEDTAENGIDSQDTEARPRRSNKNLLAFVAIGITLLLLVGGVGSYNFIQKKNSEENEIAYWKQCVIENNPLSYSKYLVQYPSGRFTTEAESRIRQLRDSERKEWETLRNSNNVDALSTFLSDHPETPYKREINHAIDSLSWLAILKDNTADAYLAYINNVNLGRYTGDYLDVAQQKYDYLSQLRTVEGDELNDIKKVIESLYKYISSADSKNFQKITTPTISKFYGTEEQSNKVIVDSIKTLYKKNKIRNISYLPVTDSIEVIQDNKGVYFTSFTVKSETIYSDRKKKKETSEHTVNLELDGKKLVQAVYKNG